MAGLFSAGQPRTAVAQVFFYLLIVVLCAIPIYAQNDYPDFEMRHTTIYKINELPDGLSFKTLLDSLSSPSVPIRISAINRITQICDMCFVPALINAYKIEPYVPKDIYDVGPGQKYLILRALGKIGGVEAYNFLKELQYQLPNQNQQILESGGDPDYVYYGLFNSLARLEPLDSAGIYLKIYNQNEFDDFIRVRVYETYERIMLKDTKYKSLQDSLYYLLDTSKKVNLITQLDSSRRQTPEFMKRDAIRGLVMVYGAVNPSIINEYKSTISINDPFMKEIEKIQGLVAQEARNKQSKAPK